MMKSLRGVSIALFALLMVASVCPPASAQTPTPPADSAAAAPVAPATPAPAAAETPAPAAPVAPEVPLVEEPKFGIPGQASFGGSVGISRFLADADYTQARDGGGSGRDLWGTRDAAMRFAFGAHLRYTASRRVRWQVNPGFLWTGYKENSPAPFSTTYFPDDSLKDEYLTLVMPLNAQVQLLQRTSKWLLHLGVGGGAYRVWVQQDRHVLKDPVTRRLHKGFYPGATAELGAERFLKSMPAVSLEWVAATHLVFAQRDDQFPSGFNSNVWTSEVRFGANYHFNPRARKKSTGAGR